MSGFTQPPTAIPGDLAVSGNLDITGTYYVNGVPIAQERDNFVGEVPVGTVDGSNVTFILTNTPIAGSLLLFLNGMLQKAGGDDYSLTGTTITFNIAPETGAMIQSHYRY